MGKIEITTTGWKEYLSAIEKVNKKRVDSYKKSRAESDKLYDKLRSIEEAEDKRIEAEYKKKMKLHKSFQAKPALVRLFSVGPPYPLRPHIYRPLPSNAFTIFGGYLRPTVEGYYTFMADKKKWTQDNAV